MKQVFTNSDKLQCIFTDDGVTFCGETQEIYFPYGCLDTINLSLLGVLQATSRARICTFTADRKDRSELKQMVRYARDAMAGAPKAEVQVIDLTQKADAVSPELSPAEQLKKYKMLFVQGAISKEEYDAKKRLLKE